MKPLTIIKVPEGCRRMSASVGISNEVIYYFGRQPLIFNLTGVLIDSADNNWFVDWVKLYSEFFRGTQTAKNYELIKIVLPNMIITGTISAFSWQQDSSRDTDIPFSNTQQLFLQPGSDRPIRRCLRA